MAGAAPPSTGLMLFNARVVNPSWNPSRDQEFDVEASPLSCIYTGGESILSIQPQGPETAPALDCFQAIDCSNCLVVPGFVDLHVHVTGGGGEAGYRSRTPEAKLSELVDGGITTFVGVLGTDSVTRSLANLLAKVKALKEEGLSGYMYTGAYRIPTPTLTGSVMSDIMLIEEVIGVGEIAIGDHRGSHPTPDEFLRVASEVRTGGMLANKPGIIFCHLGESTPLHVIHEAMASTSRPPFGNISVTHVDRTREIFEASMQLAGQGAWADFSGHPRETVEYLNSSIEDWPRAAWDRLTVSSDAYGSLPEFNLDGSIKSYTYGRPSVLLDQFRALVRMPSGLRSINEVLNFFTRNPVERLGLSHRKGSVAAGYDADLLVLDSTTLELKYVIARGKVMKSPEDTAKGMFEETRPLGMAQKCTCMLPESSDFLPSDLNTKGAKRVKLGKS